MAVRRSLSRRSPAIVPHCCSMSIPAALFTLRARVVEHAGRPASPAPERGQSRFPSGAIERRRTASSRGSRPLLRAGIARAPELSARGLGLCAVGPGDDLQ
jgi:hypothetical protein